MLYQVKNGSVELGANRVLRKIDFEIREGEKIAIVGRNGCGKTTLLRLILGEVDLSRNGEDTRVTKGGRLKIGCLSQGAFSDLSKSVDEEIQEVFSDILKKKARLEELLEKMQSSSDVRIIDEFNALQSEFEIQGGYFYEK
ncbi:MAG: ABC-F family ATP-binding cassette domain-containing protein, partial [Clostridia bacterium]|nr:ABC-F family ATP-binding cassette domain-containing protein [Clostridia bacterium]